MAIPDYTAATITVTNEAAMSVRVTGEALAPFLKILQDFCDCSREKDVKGVLSRFTPDEDLVSFGQLANKYGKSEFREHVDNCFSHGDAEVPEYSKVVVYQYGEAACLCALASRRNDHQPETRVTLYLENHEGQWLIRHRHHSQLPDSCPDSCPD